jgi:hypothetical protein
VDASAWLLLQSFNDVFNVALFHAVGSPGTKLDDVLMLATGNGCF